MGIKSTRTLERSDAIQLYVHMKMDIASERQRAKSMTKALSLSDSQLADALDRVAEEIADLRDMTCFDNFLVIPDVERNRST